MAAEVSADLNLIQDEDVLRKMWAETEDFDKKKDIRARMYKLREQRLKDFYTTGEVVSEITGRKHAATTHTESIGDQGFLTMKTKEIRDSESPTRDFNQRNKTGYWVSAENKDYSRGNQDGVAIERVEERRKGEGLVVEGNTETRMVHSAQKIEENASLNSDNISLTIDTNNENKVYVSTSHTDTGDCQVSSENQEKHTSHKSNQERVTQNASHSTKYSSSSSTVTSSSTSYKISSGHEETMLKDSDVSVLTSDIHNKDYQLKQKSADNGPEELCIITSENKKDSFSAKDNRDHNTLKEDTIYTNVHDREEDRSNNKISLEISKHQSENLVESTKSSFSTKQSSRVTSNNNTLHESSAVDHQSDNRTIENPAVNSCVLNESSANNDKESQQILNTRKDIYIESIQNERHRTKRDSHDFLTNERNETTNTLEPDNVMSKLYTDNRISDDNMFNKTSSRDINVETMSHETKALNEFHSNTNEKILSDIHNFDTYFQNQGTLPSEPVSPRSVTDGANWTIVSNQGGEFVYKDDKVLTKKSNQSESSPLTEQITKHPSSLEFQNQHTDSQYVTTYQQSYNRISVDNSPSHEFFARTLRSSPDRLTPSPTKSSRGSLDRTSPDRRLRTTSKGSLDRSSPETNKKRSVSRGSLDRSSPERFAKSRQHKTPDRQRRGSNESYTIERRRDARRRTTEITQSTLRDTTTKTKRKFSSTQQKAGNKTRISTPGVSPSTSPTRVDQPKITSSDSESDTSQGTNSNSPSCNLFRGENQKSSKKVDKKFVQEEDGNVITNMQSIARRNKEKSPEYSSEGSINKEINAIKTSKTKEPGESAFVPIKRKQNIQDTFIEEEQKYIVEETNELPSEKQKKNNTIQTCVITEMTDAENIIHSENNQSIIKNVETQGSIIKEKSSEKISKNTHLSLSSPHRKAPEHNDTKRNDSGVTERRSSLSSSPERQLNEKSLTRNTNKSAPKSHSRSPTSANHSTLKRTPKYTDTKQPRPESRQLDKSFINEKVTLENFTNGEKKDAFSSADVLIEEDRNEARFINKKNVSQGSKNLERNVVTRDRKTNDISQRIEKSPAPRKEQKRTPPHTNSTSTKSKPAELNKGNISIKKTQCVQSTDEISVVTSIPKKIQKKGDTKEHLAPNREAITVMQKHTSHEAERSPTNAGEINKRHPTSIKTTSSTKQQHFPLTTNPNNLSNKKSQVIMEVNKQRFSSTAVRKGTKGERIIESPIIKKHSEIPKSPGSNLCISINKPARDKSISNSKTILKNTVQNRSLLRNQHHVSTPKKDTDRAMQTRKNIQSAGRTNVSTSERFINEERVINVDIVDENPPDEFYTEYYDKTDEGSPERQTKPVGVTGELECTYNLTKENIESNKKTTTKHEPSHSTPTNTKNFKTSSDKHIKVSLNNKTITKKGKKERKASKGELSSSSSSDSEADDKQSVSVESKLSTAIDEIENEGIPENSDHLKIIVQHPKSSRESSPGYPSVGAPFYTTSEDGESNPRYADFISEPEDVEVFDKRGLGIPQPIRLTEGDGEPSNIPSVADRVHVFLENTKLSQEKAQPKDVNTPNPKSVLKAKTLFENIAKKQTTEIISTDVKPKASKTPDQFVNRERKAQSTETFTREDKQKECNRTESIAANISFHKESIEAKTTEKNIDANWNKQPVETEKPFKYNPPNEYRPKAVSDSKYLIEEEIKSQQLDIENQTIYLEQGSPSLPKQTENSSKGIIPDINHTSVNERIISKVSTHNTNLEKNIHSDTSSETLAKSRVQKENSPRDQGQSPKRTSVDDIVTKKPFEITNNVDILSKKKIFERNDVNSTDNTSFAAGKKRELVQNGQEPSVIDEYLTEKEEQTSISTAETNYLNVSRATSMDTITNTSNITQFTERNNNSDNNYEKSLEIPDSTVKKNIAEKTKKTFKPDDQNKKLREGEPGTKTTKPEESIRGTFKPELPKKVYKKPSPSKEPQRKSSKPEEINRRLSKTGEITRRTSESEEITRRPFKPEEITEDLMKKPSVTEDKPKRSFQPDEISRKPSKLDGITKITSKPETIKKPSRTEEIVKKFSNKLDLAKSTTTQDVVINRDKKAVNIEQKVCKFEENVAASKQSLNKRIENKTASNIRTSKTSLEKKHEISQTSKHESDTAKNIFPDESYMRKKESSMKHRHSTDTSIENLHRPEHKTESFYKNAQSIPLTQGVDERKYSGSESRNESYTKSTESSTQHRQTPQQRVRDTSDEKRYISDSETENYMKSSESSTQNKHSPDTQVQETTAWRFSRPDANNELYMASTESSTNHSYNPDSSNVTPNEKHYRKASQKDSFMKNTESSTKHRHTPETSDRRHSRSNSKTESYIKSTTSTVHRHTPEATIHHRHSSDFSPERNEPYTNKTELNTLHRYSKDNPSLISHTESDSRPMDSADSYMRSTESSMHHQYEVPETHSESESKKNITDKTTKEPSINKKETRQFKHFSNRDHEVRSQVTRDTVEAYVRTDRRRSSREDSPEKRSRTATPDDKSHKKSNQSTKISPSIHDQPILTTSKKIMDRTQTDVDDKVRGKFGVTLRSTVSSNIVTSKSVLYRGRAEVDIESIFDLELLEEMLLKAVGYDDRRRIRAQIRLVKKQIEDEKNNAVQGRTTKLISTVQSTIPSVKDIKREPNQENRVSPERPSTSQRQPNQGTSVSPERFNTSQRHSGNDSRVSPGRPHSSPSTSPDRKRQIHSPDRRPADELQNATRKSSSGSNVKSPPSNCKPSSTYHKPNDRKSASPDRKQASLEKSTSRKTTREKTLANGVKESRTVYETTMTVHSQNVKKMSSDEVKEPNPTDLITSSYGVGPTDENGRPLFGLKALRKTSTTKTLLDENEKQENIIEEGESKIFGLTALQSESMPAESKQLKELVERHQQYVKESSTKDVQPTQKPKAKLRDSFILTEDKDLSSKETQQDDSNKGLSLKSIIQKRPVSGTAVQRSMESTSTVIKSHSSVSSDGKVSLHRDVIHGEMSSRNGDQPSGRVIKSSYSYQSPQNTEGAPSVKSSTTTSIISGGRRSSGPKIKEITDSTATEIDAFRRNSKEYTVQEEETAVQRRRSSGHSVDENVKLVSSILKKSKHDNTEQVRRMSGPTITDVSDETEGRNLSSKGPRSSDITDLKTASSNFIRGEENRTEISKKLVTHGDSVKSLQHKFQQATESSSLKQSFVERSDSKSRIHESKETRTEERTTSPMVKSKISTERTEVVESTHTSRSEDPSSFLDNNTKVSGVQDILTRMRNADLVSKQTDSAEDAEARALLNKFLGASVILQGMEQNLRAAQLKETDESVPSPASAALVIQAEKQLKVKASSAHTVQDDIDDITDEKQLRILLDACTDYEGRRKLRARLRTLMAEPKGLAVDSEESHGSIESSEVQKGDTIVKTEVHTRTTSSTAKLTKANSVQSPFAKFRQLERQNSAPSAGRHSPLYKFTEPKLALSASTIKERLLSWVKAQTRHYKNIQIENFSTSWSNGLAFCALIHHFYPNAFDYDTLTPENRRYNFELAFRVAEEEADIFPLLDVEDMVVMRKPDWKCVFTYVQSIYRRFHDSPDALPVF